MKPRIFINMHYMEIGGAERALLGLLNAIDTNKVDVDLFINQHTGEFMKLIPEKINLLPMNNEMVMQMTEENRDDYELVIIYINTFQKHRL